MKAKLPDDVMRAIEQAKRTQGWNNRRDDVQRFELANVYGHEPCTLYVVPCRRWAYRRWEHHAQDRQRACAGSAARRDERAGADNGVRVMPPTSVLGET